MGEVALSRDLEEVRRARSVVADRLRQLNLSDLAEDAALVVSELVANAVLHGGEPIRLGVREVTGGVRLEVWDASPRQPIRAPGGAEGMTGRGLLVVEALCAEWGCEREGPGKTVWATVTRGGGHGADQTPAEEVLARWADDAPVEPDTALRYDIELGDVPTDLLVAAKSHVDNLIREFALAVAGEDKDTMPARLVELLRTVTTRFVEPRQDIKRQAIAAASRGEALTRLHLALPREAAEAAREYLDGLNQVDEYCRAARLLTLESPPQHRVFREWYINEIVKRLRAAAVGEPAPSPTTFGARLLQEVDRVTAAERAADRAARIYRVAAVLAGSQNAQEVARAVLDEVLPALRADGAVIVTPLGDRLSVTEAIGYEHELVTAIANEPIEADLPAAWVLRHWEPVWLESREELRRRFPEMPDFEPRTVSMCVVPLQIGKRKIGALRISFSSPRLFDDQERDFVSALGAQAAQALERTRLAEEEHRNHQRMSMLADASVALSESLDYEVILRTIARLTVPDFADWAVVHLLRDGEIRTVAVEHVDPSRVKWARELDHGRKRQLDEPVGVAKVLRTGATEFHPDVPDEFLHVVARGDPERLAILRRVGFRSVIVAPMTARGRTFGTLGLVLTDSERRFDPDDVPLAEDLARRAALAVDNALLFRHQAEVAEALQSSLLPPRLPQIPGVELTASYRPATEEVGGDFYDAWPIDATTWAFAIGDVCGTGPRAASLTAVVRATLRSVTLTEACPVTVLQRLNTALVRGLEEEDGERFCTVLFGVLHIGEGAVELEIASGGHPLPILRTPEGTRTLRVTGSLIGAFEDVSIDSVRITLAPGDLLVLYTDGVVDSPDANGRPFGDERLLAMVRDGSATPGDLVAALSQVIPDAADDMAILALRACPPDL